MAVNAILRHDAEATINQQVVQRNHAGHAEKLGSDAAGQTLAQYDQQPDACSRSVHAAHGILGKRRHRIQADQPTGHGTTYILTPGSWRSSCPFPKPLS